MELKGASFGNIVALIGSILIALGVAWLIAQNWHQMPSAIKILILLIATASAYIAGTIMRVKDYPGIGKSLLVLGALLYTLSIFLIAQIFFTQASTQGTAWLLLISWAGVLASSMVFKSTASFFVAIAEFIIWVFWQGAAFADLHRLEFSYVLIAYFIITGVAAGIIALFLLISKIRSSEKTKSLMKLLITLLVSNALFWSSLVLVRPQTLQGVSWIVLISFLSVTFFAYFLRSPVSLIVALFELISWLIIQYATFSVAAEDFVSPGILAFYFLFVAVLLYGLSLLHRTRLQIFSRIYIYFTALYLLIFTYVLSFQSLLPLMWPKETIVTTGSVVLLFFLGLGSIVTLIFGIMLAASARSVKMKEVAGVVSVVLVLGILIGVTSFASDLLGNCYKKNCYDYRNLESCENPGDGLDCDWDNNYCKIKRCQSYTAQAECEARPNTLSCNWLNGKCFDDTCFNYANESSCIGTPPSMNCAWKNEVCQEETCWQFRTQSECENTADILDCRWDRNSCYIYDRCTDFNNEYEQCSQDNECNWRTTGSIYSRDRHIPTTIWVIWIIINIAFIMLILAIIGYGTWVGWKQIINLGIIFFALEIVTRYIGFMMDLWGYTSLSVVFITGGIVLIAGGWGIERWRRKLIDQVKQTK